MDGLQSRIPPSFPLSLRVIETQAPVKLCMFHRMDSQCVFYSVACAFHYFIMDSYSGSLFFYISNRSMFNVQMYYNLFNFSLINGY